MQPGHARHLVGQSNRDLVGVHPGLQANQPVTEPVTALVEMDEAGSCAMDQQSPDIGVAALGDAEQLLLASGRVRPQR